MSGHLFSVLKDPFYTLPDNNGCCSFSVVFHERLGWCSIKLKCCLCIFICIAFAFLPFNTFPTYNICPKFYAAGTMKLGIFVCILFVPPKREISRHFSSREWEKLPTRLKGGGANLLFLRKEQVSFYFFR
ncbi:hypothetical protein POVWA2_000870 [Plasmodium ovale wallikeri]|uniref:Uncharacterized protein n=1 Tax=Plasmodium ovale wallikeri TaxID=864142 RepID=A0A1A8YGY6_PLAOA|nr:hypothetical protein POVWA1_000600 [Plasmodium ovale wallikeri]SBT30809.1 hypothetical protein POVWA2_000870 [Plasmodium ovale wallikeri]